MVRGSVVDITIENKKTSKTRLFCTAPSRHFPTAVLRNKIKRWCREAWRSTQLSKKTSVVTTVRVKGKEPSFKSIQKDLNDAEKATSAGVGAKPELHYY